MKKSKSYRHRYPHYSYNIVDVQMQNSCEWNYWMTVDDSGRIPSLKADVWFAKHKNLMPYMKNEDGLDIFLEYIHMPRNRRKCLNRIHKSTINHIVGIWSKNREIDIITREILDMNKDFRKYIDKHGNERLSNTHLIFVNDFMHKIGIGEYGVIYKLSNYIYSNLKNKTDKTLKEIIDTFLSNNKWN